MTKFTAIWLLASVAFGVLGLVVRAQADPPHQKAPLPSDSELQQSVQRLEGAYRGKIAKAKSAGEREALAQTFFEIGEEPRRDKTACYAALSLARDTAVEAGNLELVVDIISVLDGKYQIDALRMKADSAAAASKSLPKSIDRVAYLEQLSAVLEQAIAAERFDIAEQLAVAAVNVARQTDDPALIASASEHAQFVKDYQAAYSAVQGSSAMLAQKPADTDANLAVGRFRCFIKGDWTAGLPFLAKGSDATIRALAENDLIRPADAGAQLALADGWWKLAENETGVARHQIQRRARKWYYEASPELSGLKRVRVDSRLKHLVAIDQSEFMLGNETDIPSVSSKARKPASPVVVKARWGGGNHWSDVTKRVRETVVKGESVYANPGFLKSDPTPGWRKHLQITYDKLGDVKSIEIDEDREWTYDDSMK